MIIHFHCADVLKGVFGQSRPPVVLKSSNKRCVLDDVKETFEPSVRLLSSLSQMPTSGACLQPTPQGEKQVRVCHHIASFLKHLVNNKRKRIGKTQNTHDQKIYYLKLRNKTECGNDDGETRLSFSHDIQAFHITSDETP